MVICGIQRMQVKFESANSNTDFLLIYGRWTYPRFLFLYQETHTGERYVHFLLAEFEDHLDDTLLEIRYDMLFHQDGAPPTIEATSCYF